ncbi:MAG: hypothetical protein ACKO3R_00070 [bacterium]
MSSNSKINLPQPTDFSTNFSPTTPNQSQSESTQTPKFSAKELKQQLGITEKAANLLTNNGKDRLTEREVFEKITKNQSYQFDKVDSSKPDSFENRSNGALLKKIDGLDGTSGNISFNSGKMTWIASGAVDERQELDFSENVVSESIKTLKANNKEVTVNNIIQDLKDKEVIKLDDNNHATQNKNLYNNLIALRDSGIGSADLEAFAKSNNREDVFNDLLRDARDNIVSTNTSSVASDQSGATVMHLGSVDPSKELDIKIKSPIVKNTSISVIVDGDHRKPVQLTQGTHYDIRSDGEGESILSITSDGFAKLGITNPSAGGEGKEHSFQIWGIEHQKTKEPVYIPKIKLTTSDPKDLLF